VVEAWPAAVGETIARNAWPARIARDGTVHVSTSDAVWAFELGHQAAEIASRLGVPGLRFAPGPLPEHGRTEARREAPAATSRQELEAAAIAAGISDQNLRESVQKAVLLSLVRDSGDPRL
jgi:hypothetical protein